MKCLVKDNDDSRKTLTNWMWPKVEMCARSCAIFRLWLSHQVKDTSTSMTSSSWLGQNHQDNRWSFGTENVLHKNNFIAAKRGQGFGHFWQTAIYQREEEDSAT